MVVSATIEAPSGERKTLWHRVAEEHARHLAGSSDHSVVGAIYFLMEAGHDVRVHGQVSPSLLRNLDEFMEAWSAWVPGLTRVAIRADREEETRLPEGRHQAIVAFSGGVDSCFTAFRHARAGGRLVPQTLAAGLMVHGFDIPLNESESFKSAADRSRTMLVSLGLELISVATNYRSLVADWSHSFGAAIASCLMLFAEKFGIGLIGQGLTYGEFHLLREGSNPLTDPLLSSDGFRIVPDGAAFERAEKIDAMSGWDEFLRHLRVCWQGPQKDRNCCQCEKCIRNILTFRALGLGLPPCFPEDVQEESLKTFRLGKGALPSIRYEGLLSLAAARGVEGAWLETIRKRLARDRRLQHSRVLRHVARLGYYRGRLWDRLTGRG